MPEFEDKLQERAAKLQERAAKLQEREAKLQEREAKLQEREALMSGIGWPFAANLLRPSGFGGFFIAAYVTPVVPGTAPQSNGTSIEDLEFQAISARIQKEQATATAATTTSTPTPTVAEPVVAPMYQSSTGGKVE